MDVLADLEIIAFPCWGLRGCNQGLMHNQNLKTYVGKTSIGYEIAGRRQSLPFPLSRRTWMGGPTPHQSITLKSVDSLPFSRGTGLYDVTTHIRILRTGTTSLLRQSDVVSPQWNGHAARGRLQTPVDTDVTGCSCDTAPLGYGKDEPALALTRMAVTLRTAVQFN